MNLKITTGDISLSKRTFIRQLHSKKYRYLHKAYLVEGETLVSELLNGDIVIPLIVCTEEFYKKYSKGVESTTRECIITNPENIKRVSSLTTPNQAIAVLSIEEESWEFNMLQNGLAVFLDDVQNPGNLGAIMRSCNWFGIQYIICSLDCVDQYNPKVIQSSAGAYRSQKVYRFDKEIFFEHVRKLNLSILGTFPDGNKMITPKMTNGVIVFGNESRGLSKEVASYVTHKLTIPSYNQSKTVESLNLSNTVAILLSNLSS